MVSKLSPTLKTTSTLKIISLAAGCFWGVERVFQKYFKGKGLVDIKVGYANGLLNFENVSYEQVCTGRTNFVEAVQISYEPEKVSLGEILDIFFRIHDPTQSNRQGPDVGTQYRSVVLTNSNEEVEIVENARNKAQAEWYPKDKIATVIEPIEIWWDAEDYHQDYLNKNPGGYECPTHFLRTSPKI